MNNQTRTPLFHISKRGELRWYQAWGIRAAALLFAKLKVSAVYAEVLSKSGARVLESNDIAYRYNKCVGSLLNSEGTDYCPYEKAVKDIADPDEAVIILKK